MSSDPRGKSSKIVKKFQESLIGADYENPFLSDAGFCFGENSEFSRTVFSNLL